MHLAPQIYNYYLSNRNNLSNDKLFHFATRTAAWFGYSESYEILRELKDYIAPAETPVTEVIREIFTAPQTGRRNAHELRQPFFKKYPTLYGAHLALFRVRHLQEVYGIDARKALFESIPLDDLIALEHALLADDDAMRILSTFAINYCYLLERVIRNNNHSLPLDHFFEIASIYDTSNKEHVQLLIYFYTHCIIGESNFYTQQIPPHLLAGYQSMLKTLEPLIEANFNDINLDNKLEFLVCARICNYETALFTPVYEECDKSLSTEGLFLVDRLNSNIQHDRNDFTKSEHRNVLYLMSTAPYTPHSTLVSKGL